MVEVNFTVYPSIGNAYTVTINVSGNRDIETQVDEWIDENLNFVEEYKINYSK